ncbi:MAG: hypothetical protein WBB67_09485 [bacterium]
MRKGIKGDDFYYRVGEVKKRFAPFGITDITHATTAPGYSSS